jgi:F-type H+-transporting ATPase subunit c
MDSQTTLAVVTTIVAPAAVVLAGVTVTYMEGRAVIAAFENMARQPSVADRISGQILILLAVIESAAIYALVIALILLLANPFSYLLK